MRPHLHFVATLATALLSAVLGACAGLPAARMALPESLSMAPHEELRGLGAGERGEFSLGADRGRFDRYASRLELFDLALARERRAASFRLGGVAANCQGRETTTQIGIVGAALQPYRVQCEWRGGADATMDWGASSAELTQAVRSGRFQQGATVLELRSVHRVEGSPLALRAPIGVLITHEGHPVGAIELNGTRPRVWRPPAGAPMHDQVTWIALALSLLWDPAMAA